MAERFVNRLKRAARVLLYDRESRYYDDETVAFHLKTLVPILDADLGARRLNVLTSSLSASRAFGGLATQIELPILVFKHALAAQGWQLRFICTGDAPGPADNIASQYLDRHGLPPSAAQMHFTSGATQPVPVGKGDMFLGSLWYTQFWARPLMQFQLAQFGGAKTPYISMIQDYEAGFHPWSSAFMLARASYDSDWPKRLIFNSRELAAFYKAQGHPFDDSVTFEPVLNASLRDALNTDARPKKERRILFYGRPNSRRNCYYLARRALEIWAETHDGAKDWRIVSVGSDHAPFRLHGDVPLDILGKLTLAQYAGELHRAAVGLSLMASPHPSYPPLEMAHFGALTISNTFDCKDLEGWHDNLTPVEVPDPTNLAAALSDACRAFEEDPSVGMRGHSRKAHYLAPPDGETMESIAAMIAR